jgi:hypothetical protein
VRLTECLVTVTGLREVFIIQLSNSRASQVSYLVLARNGCDEFELMDEYVGETVQKLCEGKHRSRDLTSS